MLPGSTKYHVHCGMCRASIGIRDIKKVIANPTRKYHCKNCGRLTTAWTFGSALEAIAPDFEGFLDPDDYSLFNNELSSIVSAPTNTLDDVRNFLDKHLEKISSKVDKDILDILREKTRGPLSGDIKSTLLEMHLILEAERKK